MFDKGMKAALHDELRWAREAMLWKLDGLSEYDVRRPLTATGTNLLGLVKHLSMGESKYLGEVFGRPFHEHLPWWDDDAEYNVDKRATESEPRSEIIERYQRVCEHSDATINLLELDSTGQVPWWPRPDVKLINVIAHVLAETNRHAGHADILREQLDGATGRHLQYSEDRITTGSYRPYCRQAIYFDRLVNHEPGQMPRTFPTPDHPNHGFVVVAPGSDKPFAALAVGLLPDLSMWGSGRASSSRDSRMSSQTTRRTRVASTTAITSSAAIAGSTTSVITPSLSTGPGTERR